MHLSRFGQTNRDSSIQQTCFEFFDHDGSCGECDVEGRVLLWVCWRDDGHEMEAIRRVHLHNTAQSQINSRLLDINHLCVNVSYKFDLQF